MTEYLGYHNQDHTSRYNQVIIGKDIQIKS